MQLDDYGYRYVRLHIATPPPELLHFQNIERICAVNGVYRRSDGLPPIGEIIGIMGRRSANPSQDPAFQRGPDPMDVFVCMRAARRTEHGNPMTLAQQCSSEVMDIRDDPVGKQVYGPAGRHESDMHGILFRETTTAYRRLYSPCATARFQPSGLPCALVSETPAAETRST